MITHTIVKDQPRVLVVENDLRWQRIHKINLARWGYRAFLAEGKGEILLEDAIYKAKKYSCHVALVDMRLLDHYNRSDRSGLDLVPKLKPTRSIIVTAYSRDDLMQKGHKKNGADDFISKRTGPDPLKKALESSLNRIYKKGIRIEWQDGFSADFLLSALSDTDSAILADEFNNLLAFFFPNTKRLRLRLLEPSIYEPKVVQSRGFFLLLAYADDDFESPTVLKIAATEHIKNEGSNEIIEKSATLWNLGAIKYNFLSASPLPVVSYYHKPHTFPLESRQAAYSLGCLFYDVKHFAEAQKVFEVGHEAIEALRTERLEARQTESLVQENADLYARLVHCCVLLKDDDAAFEYGVAGKRRKMVDSLANDGFDLFTAIEKNVKAAEDTNWTTYRELLEQINQLRDRARTQTLSEEEQKSVCDEVEVLMAKQNTLWETLRLDYPTLTATQQAARFTVRQANQLASDLSGQMK